MDRDSLRVGRPEWAGKILALDVIRPIILECTEISLLVTQQVPVVPPFDPPCIHAYKYAEKPWSRYNA
jgi:aspartate/glutamate racemase